MASESEAAAVGVETVIVDGHRLEYRHIAPSADADRSDASLPTIVFLHEGLGSMGMWRDFPDVVCRETGLAGLVYSRSGYGFSDPVELPRRLDYMEHEGLVALPALLDAVEIQDVVLFGHSDGGSIGLVAAAPLGSRIRATVLEAPHVICEQVTVEGIRETTNAYDDGRLRDVLARHHADVDKTFRGWSDTWLNPEFLSWDLTGFLPAVRSPVLIIQGADDPYATLAQLDLIENGVSTTTQRLLVSNCAHSPHREQTEPVLASAAAFITAHT